VYSRLTFYSATDAAASCGPWRQFIRLKRRGRFWTASVFPVGRHPWRLPSANPPSSTSSKNPKTLRSDTCLHFCASLAYFLCVAGLVSSAPPAYFFRARPDPFLAVTRNSISRDRGRLIRGHTPLILTIRSSCDWCPAASVNICRQTNAYARCGVAPPAV
jgi:hypothetical protein